MKQLQTIVFSIIIASLLVILIKQWTSLAIYENSNTIKLHPLSHANISNSDSMNAHNGDWEAPQAPITRFLIAPSTLRWTHWPELHSWALSAHYDDRPTLGSPPLVRVIVLHRLHPRARATHAAHLLSSFSHAFCVHLDRGRRRVLHRARVAVEDSVAHAIGVRSRWAVLVLACPLPGAHVRPQYVVLSARSLPQSIAEPRNSSATGAIAAPGVNRSKSRHGDELRALPRAFVRYPPKPRLRQNFAQCVLGVLMQDSLDALDAVRLVEWVELSRALGLSALHLYLYSTTRAPNGRPDNGLEAHRGDVFRVLQHFTTDLVHVHRVEPLLIPIGPERAANDSRLRTVQRTQPQPNRETRGTKTLLNMRALSMATLQHCVYENLYAYDKLLVASLRELLVPHQPADRTLLDVVRRLEREPQLRPHPHRNYLFHSAEFYPQQISPNERAAQFATQTQLQRSSVNAANLRPRSLVDAQACVALDAERCTRLTRHANRAGHTLTAPYAIGLLHRYQPLALARDNSTCELERILRVPGICGTSSRFGRYDESALKFSAAFVERALVIIRRLRLLKSSNLKERAS